MSASPAEVRNAMAVLTRKTTVDDAAARISDREFEAIRRLVYSRFGINLGDQKKSLVVGRLQKVLRQRGFDNFGEYLHWLTEDRSGEGVDELANRISTNHTYFYREHAHFEFFAQQLLPDACERRRAAGQNEVRIWCAGCSSGEEPYTLMMLMLEHFGGALSGWKPLMLATDISATALRTAIAGVYDKDRVAKLPPGLRARYFQRTADGRVKVAESVRSQVTFRRHNLMNETFPFTKPFDAIFCRNVMIYFDRETRLNLVSKYHRHTVPGGYLFIGHSETLGRGDTEYEYVMPALYRRRK